jgi:hypothetical protein
VTGPPWVRFALLRIMASVGAPHTALHLVRDFLSCRTWEKLALELPPQNGFLVRRPRADIRDDLGRDLLQRHVRFTL